MSEYWVTASVTSTGYGDVYPHTTVEILFALIVMCGGTILFGYIFGGIAATLATAGRHQVTYWTQIQNISNYLKQSAVPEQLRRRVDSALKYMWERNRGVNAQLLFKDLPPVLRIDICMSMYQPAIRSVPLFQNKGESFTRLLAGMMQPLTLLKGEYIVRKVGSPDYV